MVQYQLYQQIIIEIFYLILPIVTKSPQNSIHTIMHALLRKYTNTITFIYDTGANGNYLCDKYAVILNNIQPTTTNPQVRLPDNTVIQPTHSDRSPLSTLKS